MKIEYEILDSAYIKKVPSCTLIKVYYVKFLKPYLRKDITTLVGQKIDGKEIVDIELHALGEECSHYSAGLAVLT